MAWNYATHSLQIPPNRIILFGESLGGAVATRLAAELSLAGTPPSGLILNSTFSSLSDVVAWQYPYFPFQFLLLDRYPTDRYIADVTCPIVMIHGVRDDFVPLHIGEKLFAAAPNSSSSGIEKRFIDLKTAGHNDIPRAILQEVVTALRESGYALDAELE